MGPVGQERWRESPVPDHAWQAVYPQNRLVNAEAQDQAAGGRARRHLEIPEGRRALGRVRLTSAGGRRVYAYLVWHEQRRRREIFLGEAVGSSREFNLRAAWSIVHDNALRSIQGRGQWHAGRHEGVS